MKDLYGANTREYDELRLKFFFQVMHCLFHHSYIFHDIDNSPSDIALSLIKMGQISRN